LSTLTEYAKYEKDVNGESGIEEVNKPTTEVQERKVIRDKLGDLWIVTPKGLKFPKGKPRNQRVALTLPEERHLIPRFANAFPCVKTWLETFESENTRKYYGMALLDFCVYTDMKPSEFGDLWKSTEQMVKARQLATEFIRHLKGRSAWTASHAINALKSFFRVYSSGFHLPLDSGRGGAVEIKESSKAKFRRKKFNWGSMDEFRKTIKAIIANADNLKARTALTLLYRAGIRDNVLDHITVEDVQDYIEIEGTELLCLTITAKIDYKLRNVVMPLPSGENGYYTFISGEALELFKRFMHQCHADSSPETPVFRHDRAKLLNRKSIRYAAGFRIYLNRVLEKIGLPSEQIWPHQLRGLFNQLAHHYCSTNNAEFLTGHKLRGVQESYQWRNKNDLAIEYLKIRFEPITEEEARLTKKVQDFEKRLNKIEGIEEPTVPETPKTPEQPTQPKVIGKVTCLKDGKLKSTKECEDECNEWVSCSPYAKAMEEIWKKEEEQTVAPETT